MEEDFGLTRRLNKQVRRNIDKFPEDFMFQLTQEEFANLKSPFKYFAKLGIPTLREWKAK
ncbi:MAG: ORF6N domain-containing protein [Desulfobacteraceae bacterium]|uniref:ORF6N domain-containing protein n=1 Tax=Candidatus Desulfaltia bathyphila TaxID=2841697 RepID=A0A8J6N546_9BACT|nr:ORF6N domain-containing protein [Candidatus Desulfaltia bathyphila]